MPKLPGAQLGRSQEALSKPDASAPLRIANARAATMQTIRDTTRSTTGYIQKLYDEEAMRQVAAASPKFQESIKTSMLETIPYDDDGQGVWLNSKKVFKEYTDKALDDAGQENMSYYGKLLFKQRALEIEESLIPQWGAKVKEMQRVDSSAAYSAAIEDNLESQQFGMARDSVVDAKLSGTWSPEKAQKVVEAIDYADYRNNVEIDIDMSTIRGDWEGDKLVTIRDEIDADTKLSPADKTKMIARLESTMLTNFVDGFHETLAPIEVSDGRIAAYEAGEEILKDHYKIEPRTLGGDEHWRHEVYAALKTANAHYYDAAKKDSKQLKLIERIRNAHTGDQYNDDTLYDGGFNVMLGRETTEKGQWEQTGVGVNDTELLENKDNALFGDAYNYTLHGNRVPPVLEGLLSATLETPRSKKQLDNTLDFIGRLVTSRPESITWQTKSTHIQDVATLTDFYGNNEVGRGRAYEMWKSWREVKNDKGKLAARNELASDLKAKQFFDDEFEGAIKAKYGADLGFMGVLDKGVGIKPLLKADSRAIYDKFVLMTGDPTEALAITTNAMRYTFGASKVGSGDLELKKYPIEKVVTSNVLDEDERADAINTQIKDSLNQNGLPSENFVVEAIDGMDPRFPQYLIKSFGESAMPSISLYAPELDKTAAYQGKMKAKKLRDSLTDKLAETRVLGAESMLKDKEKFGTGFDVPLDPDRDGQSPSRFRLNTLLKTQELVESLLGPTTTAEQRKQAAEAPLDTDVQKENLLVDIDRRLRQDRFLSDVGGND